MRCINMEIVDVFLFSINLMAIYCNVIPQNRTSQPVDNSNFNKFQIDCPDLWKTIQSNNLTEWTNCQNESVTSKKITEAEVLNFACFLAKNLMMYICDHKLNMTNEYLRLPEKSTLCPFQFSELLEPRYINESNLVKELTEEKHCLKVCYDLYETRIQCVILKKLINYLTRYEKQTSRPGLVSYDGQKSSEIDTPTQKTDKVGVKLIEEKMSKELIIKNNTETTSNKASTSLVKLQTDETKKPEWEIPEKKDKDFMNASMGFVVHHLKNEVSEVTDVQRNTWEDNDETVQIPFSRKKIDSSDGFLQAEDSHFFFYFIAVSSIIVVGYIGFHNKNKILAYALEGTSGRRSRRRPNPARYRKLETNLEEAISSNASETIASSIVY